MNNNKFVKAMQMPLLYMIITGIFSVDAISRFTDKKNILIAGVLFIFAFAVLVIFENLTQGKRKWLLISLFSYLIICAKFPLSTYNAQFFSEAGSDFFANAKSMDFLAYWLTPESGLYFSNVQRLVSWFVVRILHANALAPFLMTNILILFVVLTAGCFVSERFEHVASENARVIITIVFLQALSNDWMYTFVVISYFFVIFLLELYLINLEALPTWKYVIDLVLVVFIMTSKAFYLLWIPLAALALIVFWRKGCRFRIYNYTIILGGLIELFVTLMLSNGGNADRGEFYVQAVKPLELINMSVYNWVQGYVTFFGASASGIQINVAILLLLILVCVICILKLVKTKASSKGAWLVLFSQAAMLGEYAMVDLIHTNKLCSIEVHWRSITPLNTIWYTYWINIAIFITCTVVMIWISNYLSDSKKARFVLLPIVLIPLFLNGAKHNEYDYACFGDWRVYTEYADCDSFALATYDSWPINKNVKAVGCDLEAESDTVDFSAYSEEGFVAIYFCDTVFDKDYVINLYDENDNLILSQQQLATNASYHSTFCFKEPVYGVVTARFTDVDGNPMKVSTWNRCYVED